jgi:DNA-binding transcriptional LysR family regulator
MELRHVRYFLAVAEERNFTRAAARVGIGQPPLSQQIKDLEAEVGAALFRRMPQGAELTAAGEAFMQVVQGFPAQAERAMHAAKRAARGESGSLRVGFTNSAVFNPVVAVAVRSFRRAYPDVELLLEQLNTTGLVSAVTEGRLDAVFLRPGSAGSEDLHVRVLSEEPMVAVLPAGHAAAKTAEVDLAELRSDPFVLAPRAVGPTLFDTIVTACRKAGFEPVLGQSAPAPQMASLIHFVAAELGVSLVPASMQSLKVPGVVYRELAGRPTVLRLALASRRGDTSPVLRNFIARATA